MKRKIIIGLLLQTTLFLAGGAYLASKVHAATTDVTSVVRLHQVAHLREHYLLRLKSVQADLILAGTTRPHPGGVVAAHAVSMETAIERCFACHHTSDVTRSLDELRGKTALYRGALARMAAAPVDSDARRAAGEDAFRVGEGLIAEVEELIDRSTRNLERHTLDAMTAIARTNYVALALVVLGPLLSAILGLVWISSLTRPFGVLIEATHRFKRGDLDHRVEGLHDEFRGLAASFNEMASSLKEQMQLMQRTEQMVVVGELAAGLVHEIKNPLAGIKAAVQVLTREAQVSSEDRAILEKVEREVVGLESLLRAFLEFARPPRPQLADVDVNAVVESVVGFYMKSHAVQPGRPVRVTRALGPVPSSRVDPMHLKQVLLNLLLNAVDASPNAGGVEVRTWFDAGAIRIDVADRGRGISPEHVDKIFRPFFTTKPRGTGLGLAVSKRLVEQHGGSIHFVHNPGGGTIFRVQLPPAAQAQAQARSA